MNLYNVYFLDPGTVTDEEHQMYYRTESEEGLESEIFTKCGVVATFVEFVK